MSDLSGDNVEAAMERLEIRAERSSTPASPSEDSRRLLGFAGVTIFNQVQPTHVSAVLAT
jgi:hypothetical protein